MATITGFTSERMLEIENTTVVDGEVQGDNLILMTREGTEIDAGNVRGPVGPVGPAGPVSSVNDQTGASYAPRIFTDKAALDSAWAAAPRGALAVTTDNESIWEKNATAWNINNGARIFASVAERNARWPTPPYGSLCITADNSYMWQYTVYGWTKPWQMPWGEITWLSSPSLQSINVSGGMVPVNGLNAGSLTIPPGRRIQLYTEIKFMTNAPDETNNILMAFREGTTHLFGAHAHKESPSFSSGCLTLRINTDGNAHTYFVGVQVGGGWVNVQATSIFQILDIGPV